MRGLIAAAATGLMMTACAIPQQPVAAGGNAWGGGDRALNAYIVPPEQGGLRFHVNRPAYAAVFEIVPDGGTRMVYPAPGVGRMDGFVFSSARLSAVHGYWGGLDRFTSGVYSHEAELTRPRYFFLIASERPLDLDAFGTYGTGMHSVLGHHYYAATNAYATMERLAEVALPSMVDDGTWTTDLYVYWPQALRLHRASRDVLVRCRGYTMFVAYEYAYQARHYLCGGQGDQVAVRPRPTPPRTGPAGGGDSTVIEQPGRRAPLPPAGEAATRRVTSSRQLQHPQSRRPWVRTAVEEDITVTAPEAERTERPQVPAERAMPQNQRPGRPVPEPRTVRPAPEPRTARPVTAEPPRGQAGAPGPERYPAVRPTPGTGVGTSPTPRRATEGPPRATPRPDPTRPAIPAARPASRAPVIEPPTPSAPAKKRDGGGGGDPDHR